MSPEPVNLAEAARLLGAELEHLAASTGHVLDVQADGEVWCVADESRVLQIGRALVSNAMIHSPSGTPVTIRAERYGDRARLAVEDDGPGIPAPQREAIFERFYRVEGGVASGSGLGLAIAREIAKLMGGSVALVSERHPTVFVLDLPAAAPDDLPGPLSFSRENGAALAGARPAAHEP